MPKKQEYEDDEAQVRGLFACKPQNFGSYALILSFVYAKRSR
jgi:hypothetical protein